MKKRGILPRFLLCIYFISPEFMEELFYILAKALVIEDHGKAEGQGRNQNKRREDHPEPWPVFHLAGIGSDRDILEEVRTEQREEVTNSITFMTPNIGGVFVVNGEEIVLLPKVDESELKLEHLVEHDEQHQQKQTNGRGPYPLIG